MLHFGASSMDMMLWQIKIHEDVLSEIERDARTAPLYRRKFASEVEPQLRSRLERHPFICGDGFLAVDCMIAHNVMWAKGYGMCQSGLAKLSARLAFTNAFSDLHLFTKVPPREARCSNCSPADDRSIGTPSVLPRLPQQPLPRWRICAGVPKYLGGARVASLKWIPVRFRQPPTFRPVDSANKEGHHDPLSRGVTVHDSPLMNVLPFHWARAPA
jgi:hypothetical protein